MKPVQVASGDAWPTARTWRRGGCSAGVAFLLNGNLLVGVWKESLVVRLGKDEGEEALKEPHVKVFDITGKPMRNWVLVEPEGVEDDDQLSAWIQRAMKFVRALPAKEK